MRERSFTASSVFSGVRWTAVGQVARQLVNTVISIVLARLLSPEDYGLVAMASVFVAFLGLFQNMGTTAAIVQRKTVTDELLSSCLVLNLGLGFGMSLLALVGGPAAARLYGDVRVGRILQVLGLTFAILAMGVVHGALLNRELRFDRLIKAEIFSSLADGATAITLAYAGWKVWALVIGTLTGNVIRTVLLVVSSGWRPRLRFHWGDIKEITGFSLNLTIFNVVNYFSRNADRFIIGTALGAVPLGVYQVAYNVYTRYLEAVTGIMTRVMYPAMARLQDEKDRVRVFFLRANGGIAFLTFPMMIGLCVLAPPFVMGVLGAKWHDAIPILMILTPVGMMQAIAITTNQVYLAMGRSDLRLWWGVGSSVVLVLAFVCGIPWGVLGVVTAYAIVMVPLTYLSFYFSFHLIDLRSSELFRTLRPYFVVSIVMGAGVLCVRLLLEARGVAPLLVLGICGPIGVLIYGALMWFIRPPALADTLRLMPERLRGGVPGFFHGRVALGVNDKQV